ncbi:CLK4-associating serine/arginine rich protein [Portunus trituberculatus]|uniref:CLK4-associating serine/arginine rich protein n=1 Tax=Portunus trituberculatus TaxID=210409 RepID=A0A5B7GP15_PORTR|nr:CLK4-associating serine/arginine rich protein [Portunus trituberculatus]
MNCVLRMPWRGDADSMIDRFDVRAHLDALPPLSVTSPKMTAEEDWEERQANYERYRILIQNDFLAIKEEKFLHQIRLEEQFGPIVNKAIEEEKKALAPKKAAIAFTYTEDADPEEEKKPDSSSGDAVLTEGGEEATGDGSDEESDSDIDLGKLFYAEYYKYLCYVCLVRRCCFLLPYFPSYKMHFFFLKNAPKITLHLNTGRSS